MLVKHIGSEEETWQLDAEQGQIASVYVRFRDEADNESLGTEVGTILYMHALYLPLTVNATD